MAKSSRVVTKVLRSSFSVSVSLNLPPMDVPKLSTRASSEPNRFAPHWAVSGFPG